MSVVAIPGRVTRLFRISGEPMHPEFHASLTTLRAMRADPEVSEFHRRCIALRLQRIEAFPAAPYMPPPLSPSEAPCANANSGGGAGQPGPEAA